ncbi:hypothetical protein SNE40_015927 [Patella caerulea]
MPVKLSSRTEGHVRHVTDIDALQLQLNELTAMYRQNPPLRLLILHHIPPPLDPGTKRSSSEKFQAILYENEHPADDKEYTIAVEHVDILGKIVGDGGFSDKEFEVKSNTEHVINLIHDKAKTGARFVTAALTGSSMYQGFNFSLDGSKPVLQMDFFFDTPIFLDPEMYIYLIEPVSVIQKMNEGAFGKTVRLECDWSSHFENHLRLGWRLIDIFSDGSSKSVKTNSGKEIQKTYLWVFEKPLPEGNETIARYEGLVAEQTIRTQTEKASSIVDKQAYWEDEIVQKGQDGWELACIIQNPAISRSICQVVFGNIMFFQRLLK